MDQPSSIDSLESSAPKKLPANVRVMIALVASPTLLIMAFAVRSVLSGDWQAPGITGIIFTTLGIFAYYVVVAGRLPGWFGSKRHKSSS